MSETDTTVVFVGAGGIGHPAAIALAGTPYSIRLVDDDRVERSNLHRLVFADERDVGARKVDVVSREMIARGHDPSRIECVDARLRPDSIAKWIDGASLVIEGADNYPTKFLTADACHLAGVRVVHGAAVGWSGTVMSVVPGASACYRCVFEDLPDGEALNCSSAGVFGPLTTLVGGLMALEARRLLRGDTRHAGAVLSVDAREGRARTTYVSARRDCALCGTRAIGALEPERYAPGCNG